MSEEILIPKMKRLSGKQKEIKLPINNFILVLLCTLLIIGSTFIDINIKHFILPDGFSFAKHYTLEDFTYCFSIIPQVPSVMFVCSVLGRRLATTSVCLYLILGICFFPLFALGGGGGYIAEYGFGYLIAYLPAVFVAGSFLRKKYSFLNMLLATLFGVLIIHFIGVVYMLLLALIKGDGKFFINGWISAQSGLKILYDIVLSFISILVGKYIHSFFKFLSN